MSHVPLSHIKIKSTGWVHLYNRLMDIANFTFIRHKYDNYMFLNFADFTLLYLFYYICNNVRNSHFRIIQKGVKADVPERVSISCPTCGTCYDLLPNNWKPFILVTSRVFTSNSTSNNTQSCHDASDILIEMWPLVIPDIQIKIFYRSPW